MTDRHYDVVVAGGGHNSLISAAYLASAGYSVGLVEAMDEVGGNCVTDELFPGYFFDTCSSAHSQIQSNPIISRNELGLLDFGLEYIYPEVKSVSVFEGGDSIAFMKDVDATVAQIEAYSKADGEAYRQLLKEIAGFRDFFQVDATTPGGVPPQTRDPGLMKLSRFLSLSAYDIVKERFRHPVVQASLLFKASLTIYPVNYPGSARPLLTGIVSNHLGGWATPKGGAGQLTQALRRLIEARGAEIFCGRQVGALMLEGDRCVGIETLTGERFFARHAVISTIHVKHLVDMAPARLWGDEFLFGASTFKPGFTLFAQYLATTEPPRFQCRDGERVTIAGELPFSAEEMVRGMADHVLGRFNPRTGIVVHTGSVVDDGRAPAGCHTIKIVGPQPYALAGTGAAGWDARGQEYADAILAEVRKVAPNLTDDKIVHRAIKTPLDLERRNLHNIEGSCHGGSSLPSQNGHMRPVPGWAHHRMPIKGLYQTGATTHPGGAISGHPGRNAARVVLEDLGGSLEAVVANVTGGRA
ncbi:NAD(P)/FAD-dependent oxidoreductase [Paraburkholderia sp. J12]|uniref:phytoene desaturase family protein n=1 Tax=Paraburkholderia sp. J12 TaxID=2805432 RepID=UPI002ABD63DE|nr:NAD(P)/FAD-dependent oxidoreductase [Paraburkholderia sp. J12]